MTNNYSKIDEELRERINSLEEEQSFATTMTKKDYIVVAIITFICLVIVIGGGFIGK